MRYIIFSLFFISAVSINAQNVKLNYSKGASLLYFDVDSKTEKLSNRLGLSLTKNNYDFQIGYSNFSYSYEGKFLEINDLYKNYISDVHSAYIAYSHSIGKTNGFHFHLGLELAYSHFQIFSNLKNNLGYSYADFNIEDWSDLGFYSENNYETDLSELNIDQYDQYNLRYLNFGPFIECSYQLVDNFEIFVKSIYRKNTTDILDNINVKNNRGIASDNATDNQLDLMFGFKFQFNNNKTLDNDSLVALIDSITQNDIIIEKSDSVHEKSINEERVQLNFTKDEAKVADDKKEYILGFFDFDPKIINQSIDSSEETLDESTSILINDSIIAEPQAFINPSAQFPPDSFAPSDTIYYLIVGVFSNLSNLVSYAESLKINADNIIERNKLNYLYALKSNNISEIRQLRDDLDFECWILKVN